MIGLGLSGGGSRGKFHEGVIRWLVESGVEVDAYWGTSVGALYGGTMASCSSTAMGFAFVQESFAGIENDDIWKDHFLFGKLAGVWKESFLNSSPLEERVRSQLSSRRIAGSGKLLGVGAVNEITGVHELFREDHPEIVNAILASASFPAMFKPVKVDGRLYSDGGTRAATPPIRSLIDMGCDEIILSICHPRGIPNGGGAKTGVERAFWAIDVMGHQIIWDDERKARLYNRLISAGGATSKKLVKITTIAPDSVLNGDSLNFDPDEAAGIVEAGYQMAKRTYEHQHQSSPD